MKQCYLVLLLLILGTLSACDNKSGSTFDNPNMAGPPNNNATNFTGLVKDLLVATAENTNPLEIDAIVFNFNEDEQAFDDVL